MRQFIFTFLVLVSIGCHLPDGPRPAVVNEADSTVKKYLAHIVSNRPYDTISMHYKMLKAYYNKDTVYLNKIKGEMSMENKVDEFPPRADSCVNDPKLSDLKVNEAYRLIHSEAFCPAGQQITITIIGGSVRLHFIEYVNGQGMDFYKITQGDTIHVKPYCEGYKEFSKTLSMRDWEQLQNKIRESGYWQLVPYRYGGCVDGESWQIDSYVSHGYGFGRSDAYSVQRDCYPGESFLDLVKYFFKLSGEKGFCGDLSDHGK